MENTSNGIIEILCLYLKPGTRVAFNKIYVDLSVPLQKKWNVDLLAFGPSLHDEDSYVVVRRYKDLADRQQSQDAFYGSNEWKKGPREPILAFIENFTSVVIPANESLIEGYKMINLSLQR